MKFSESRKSIFPAYIQAKSDIEPLITSKDTSIPTKKKDDKGNTIYIKYSYAELPHIYKTIDEALAKHKIALMHDTKTENGKNQVNTILIHESGEYIESGYLEYDEARDYSGYVDMKGNNSRITTMKRISAMSLMGIASEKDTGNNGSQNYQKKWSAPPPRKNQLPTEPPPPLNQPEKFTEPIKKQVQEEEIWTDPSKQAEIERIMHAIATKHNIDVDQIFPRIQQINKTNLELDHLYDAAADSLIRALRKYELSGTNPMSKTAEEWGKK